MKKKILVAVLVCLAIVVVLGVKMGVDAYTAKKQAEQEAYEARNEAKDYAYWLKEYGSFEYWEQKLIIDEDTMKQEEIILVDTYEEFETLKAEIVETTEAQEDGRYYLDYINKIGTYDEAFFEENDLIMGFYYLGSTSISFKFKRLDVVDGVGKVVIEKKVPKAYNDMVTYWTLLVEVSKENGIKSVE
ncbi:MAG: hypothetical protein IJB96_01385 [Lachnospira sp.]|nr:hypothetical protein [Lachnospira sp.]